MCIIKIRHTLLCAVVNILVIDAFFLGLDPLSRSQSLVNNFLMYHILITGKPLEQVTIQKYIFISGLNLHESSVYFLTTD